MITKEVCPTCKGNRVVVGENKTIKCPECGGKGFKIKRI